MAVDLLATLPVPQLLRAATRIVAAVAHVAAHTVVALIVVAAHAVVEAHTAVAVALEAVVVAADDRNNYRMN